MAAYFLGALVAPNGISLGTLGLGSKSKTEFQEVDIEAVRAASKTGKPILLDARNPVSFAVGHIPKAYNVPADAAESEIEKAAKYPEIIAYCSEPSCPDSKDLAERLDKAGAKSVKLYPGGWEEWTVAEGIY
jgi:rhodanese-related sulfurtransferase